jgi:hypothetical protein
VQLHAAGAGAILGDSLQTSSSDTEDILSHAGLAQEAVSGFPASFTRSCTRLVLVPSLKIACRKDSAQTSSSGTEDSNR